MRNFTDNDLVNGIIHRNRDRTRGIRVSCNSRIIQDKGIQHLVAACNRRNKCVYNISVTSQQRFYPTFIVLNKYVTGLIIFLLNLCRLIQGNSSIAIHILQCPCVVGRCIQISRTDRRSHIVPGYSRIVFAQGIISACLCVDFRLHDQIGFIVIPTILNMTIVL